MIKLIHGFIIIGVAIALTGCQTSETRSVVDPALKQTTVNGTTLRYIEQGTGVPVIFVHGSIADHRTWDAQRDPTARKYRYIALDQRYFGPAPWMDEGKHFSIATHANDLAAFLRQLDVGPAHLVGWSYGAAVVLVLAVQYPELVRSLLLYEPGFATFVSDPTDLRAIAEGGKKMFAGGIAAVQARDEAGAVRALLTALMPCPAPSILIHADRRTSPWRTRGRFRSSSPLPLRLRSPARSWVRSRHPRRWSEGS